MYIDLYLSCSKQSYLLCTTTIFIDNHFHQSDNLDNSKRTDIQRIFCGQRWYKFHFQVRDYYQHKKKYSYPLENMCIVNIVNIIM